MRIFIFVTALLLAVSACSKKDGSRSYNFTAPGQKAEENPARYMAYEHSVEIDVADKDVASIHAAAETACRESTSDQCVILQSSIDTGLNPSASLKLRAKSSGIQKIIAALGSKGEIIHQSVKAEDLASPIEDSAKKLSMLNDYRSRLEALRGRADGNIDALIKVNQELAEVQSNIEAMSGDRAHLAQRVETEILNVSISTIRNRSFWQPVSQSLSSFGSNLSEGVSSAVTAIAYIIPWSFIFLFFGWLARRLWRGRKKVGANA